MEIRNEELNNSKRGRSKSSSAREKDEAGDDGSSEERESVSSGVPATALPPSDEILEKNLFDAIFWRKQSLASNDMIFLVFIMMLNARQQEVVGKTFILSVEPRVTVLIFKASWTFSLACRTWHPCWSWGQTGWSRINLI